MAGYFPLTTSTCASLVISLIMWWFRYSTDPSCAYIDAHPSEYPSIRWFGRHLNAFLRQTSPYAAQPVLAEMVAFEWPQGEVFDAEDSAAVTVEEMACFPRLPGRPCAWPCIPRCGACILNGMYRRRGRRSIKIRHSPRPRGQKL